MKKYIVNYEVSNTCESENARITTCVTAESRLAAILKVQDRIISELNKYGSYDFGFDDIGTLMSVHPDGNLSEVYKNFRAKELCEK